MPRSVRLFILLTALPMLLLAQEPPAAADSAAAVPAQKLVEKTRASVTIPVSDLPARLIDQRVTLAFQRNVHYEDLAELLRYAAGAVVWRTGDFGYPAFAAVYGAPARASELEFDGISWPAGNYGLINLSAIPEVLQDNVQSNVGLQFHSAPPDTATPWSHMQYAKGPFDVDALRVRFQRRFSNRVRAYWAGSFANANGQPLVVANRLRGGEADGIRLYGRTEYALSPDLVLRHRLVSARSEHVLATPFYPDQYPEILDSNADFLEKRNLNAIELARVARVAHGDRTAGAFDLWNLRAYKWDVREFTTDRSAGLFVRHHNTRYGLEGEWKRRGGAMGLTLHARAESDRVSSSSVTVPNRMRVSAAATVDGGSRSGLAWRARVTARRLEPWATQIDVRAESRLQMTRVLHAFVRVYSRPVFPAPGEYANTLAGFLQPSPGLEPARIAQARAGIGGVAGRLEFSAAVFQTAMQNLFILAAGDSAQQFINRTGNLSSPGISVSTLLRPAESGFWFLGRFDARLQSTPALLPFWYMPQTSGSAALHYRLSVFGRDLRAEAGVSADFLGRRHLPVSWESGTAPIVTQTGDALYLGGQLRLFFRDATIFLRFDNILSEDGFWADGQPFRGRVFRYGLNWTFWN